MTINSDSLPLVSVVIPFYSKVDWLIDALDSIIIQEYAALEVIVVDDGSAYEKELAAALNDKNYPLKIKVIRKKNGGPAAARNRGMIEAHGKYIAFMDSDDIWLSGKLKTQISLLEKSNNEWSQHSYYYFYENGNKKYINTGFYAGDTLLRDSFVSLKIQTSTVVVRSDAVKSKGRLKISFPENQRFGEDIGFYRQLSGKGLDSIKTPLSLFRLRKGNAGFRAEVQIMSKANVYQYLLAHNTIQISRTIKILYKIFDLENTLLKMINGNESIAKILYVIPYLLLKFEGEKIKVFKK